MRVFLLASVVLVSGFSQSFAAGGMCGGFVGAQCGANEWCSYSADNICGIADGTGICKPRPEVCTTDYMPVCGCDNVTYSNACGAHAAGASVAYVGTCHSAKEQIPANDAVCPQVIHCGTKNGQRREYPTKCAAEKEGATNISPKTGNSCEVTQ